MDLSLTLDLVQTALWIAATVIYLRRFRECTVTVWDADTDQQRQLRYRPSRLITEREEKSVISSNGMTVVDRDEQGRWVVRASHKSTGATW